MHQSLFLVAPLVVLIVILLFGFVGCSSFTEDMSTSTGATYPAAINSEPSLVAYWRLQEPSTTAIAPPPPGGIAAEEKGKFPGHYSRLNPSTGDKKRHSAANPGVINLGVTPGLLGNHPESTCVEFNGGFVSVDFDPGLNTPKFTFEAWVIADFLGFPNGNFYCLFENGAPATGKQKTEGFAIYAGPADISDPTTAYEWQVWMGDGATFTKLINTRPMPALVTFQKTTYLVLTFDGTTAVLYTYLPGTGQALTKESVAPLVATFPGFKPATSGKILIGAGRNLVPASPSNGTFYAFQGKIQEVALYSDALTLEANLVGHEQSGGPF